jgi:hypothetical protein
MKGGKLPNIIKRLLPLIEMLALFAIAALIGSCCSDCPTGPAEPQPYKGWLYALDYWDGWLYQIDLETDSVVDSLHHEENGFMTGAFDVSEDGQYLAVGFARTNPITSVVRIFNAQNLQFLDEIEDGRVPHFVEDQSMLIIAGDGIRFYSFPDLQLEFEDSIGYSWESAVLEKKHQVFYKCYHDWPRNDSQCFGLYDYLNREIVDTLIIADNQGDWFSFHQFDISEDGRYLYFGGYTDVVPSSLNCYDLETRDFVFRHTVFSVNGGVKLNPSETELYFTDPGYSTGYESPGTVFIYDSHSGSYLGGISLFGYTTDEDAFFPLYANGLIFTPDGNWAYVGTGNVFTVDGGIVVIDINKHIVKKLIWPELGHFIRHMKIGPKI